MTVEMRADHPDLILLLLVGWKVQKSYFCGHVLYYILER